MRIGLCIAAICLLAACGGRRPSSPVCVAGATLSGGKCSAQKAMRYRLPFRSGYATQVMQGYHGYLSHKDELAFSVDLRCDEGTPITAVTGGVVWDVKEDSDSGCADRSCADDANFVIIDNGDGTFSEYYHLRHLGVLVEPGEEVCQGQVIGICGNTGFSTGPHLHFDVVDTTGRTVPFQFEETLRSRGFGFPIPRARLVSENRERTTCSKQRTSTLPRDAFAHHGVILRTDLPIVVSDRGKQKLRGRYYGDHPKIALHRKSVKGGAWLDQCVSVDRHGNFELEFEWPHDRWSSGRYWMMVTGASDDCLAPGWDWSYKVWVR